MRKVWNIVYSYWIFDRSIIWLAIQWHYRILVPLPTDTDNGLIMWGGSGHLVNLFLIQNHGYSYTFLTIYFYMQWVTERLHRTCF